MTRAFLWESMQSIDGTIGHDMNMQWNLIVYDPIDFSQGRKPWIIEQEKLAISESLIRPSRLFQS